jgi:hypothetical protein
MLFMVVEHFADGKASEIYRIAREDGRHLPDGLRYVDSWVAVSLDTCFQLMECDDLALMQEWVARLEGYGRFEIVPVTTSKETFALMERLARDAGGSQPQVTDVGS